MCKIGFLWILCSLSAAAFAQQNSQVTSGQPLRIEITKQDCSRVVRHIPDADVAYQPGVGVNGRKVAPADMSQPLNLPHERMVLPLSIRPLEDSAFARLGLGASEVPLGRVEFDIKTGKISVNGQSLSNDDEIALAAACRAAAKNKPR